MDILSNLDFDTAFKYLVPSLGDGLGLLWKQQYLDFF